MYILATTRTNHEFATADAINRMMHRPDPDGDLRSMGGLVIVPRTVEITQAKGDKPDRIEYKPLLPRLLFIAMGEDQLHHIVTKRIMGPEKLLPPIRRNFDILPRNWAQIQAFAKAADQDCEYRMGVHEAGKKVRNVRPGDIVRMIDCSIADKELAGRIGKVVRVHRGKIHVETDIIIMGKPVTARLDPRHITGIAAE